MPTVDRLNELLDAKDEEIEKLREELEEAKHELELEHAWTRHRESKEDSTGLPIPRLELVWTKPERGSDLACDFNLVMRRYYGDVWIVPLGAMRVCGGRSNPVESDGSLYLPSRITSEILATANILTIPAFVRWAERSESLSKHVEKYRKDLVARGVVQG